MIIQKLLHSCLLIEECGKRILIDPGDYCFAEKLITPESLAPIDLILITHNHADHCDVDALRKIQAKKILTCASTHATLAAAGIFSDILNVGEVINVGECTIRGINAPHDTRLTSTPPESIGFLINEKLLHPGDSLNFDNSVPYKVLALPIAAPWMVRKEAIDLGIKLKPKHVIPIHDGMFKSFAADANIALFKKLFGLQGIELHPLRLGEVFEI